MAAKPIPGIKIEWSGIDRLRFLCSRRLRDSQTAGQGVLKKIGIRANAGEAGGCDTLQSADLARQVRAWPA